MANPYIGEIRMFAGNFAPSGWEFCSGQLLPIAEYDALFNLIGTTYGGDGQSTFALPDLQGRLPIHSGSNSQSSYVIGQKAGVETVMVTAAQMPAHTHVRYGSSSTADSRSPSGELPAVSTHAAYGTTTAAPMASTALSSTGGNVPHDNLQPFACVSFIISLFGIFPTQS